MLRRTITAVLLTAIALAAQPIHAQSPSATPSKEPTFRDFEKEPPTNLGTKLDISAGWEGAHKPALIRSKLVGGFGSLVDPAKCQLLVKDDWLKVLCRGPAARVNQLAGDTGDVTVYISNQVLPGAQGAQDDRRQLLLFIRLVPGNVTVLEVTGIDVSTGGYNDQDWESGPSLVTVDWSDKDYGPRIHLAKSQTSYMH